MSGDIMRGSFKLGWVQAALFGLVSMAFAACGGNGDTSSSTSNGDCSPGAQQGCSCPDGGQGTKVCSSDGQFGACECGGTGGMSGTGGAGGNGGSTSTSMGACGDGVEQPGECSHGGEFYCPQDCNNGTGGMGGGTPVDPCMGHVYYVDKVDGAGPIWANLPNAGGLTGLDAGNNACKSIGADHVCDHDEVMAAYMNMETKISMIPAMTTAWMQRTTPVTVGGQTYAPGPGGRCNDWKYGTNHISDGEYFTFDTAGVPTPHYDNDTFFDGVDTSHQQPGQLQCGGVMRSILCCSPSCKKP